GGPAWCSRLVCSPRDAVPTGVRQPQAGRPGEGSGESPASTVPPNGPHPPSRTGFSTNRGRRPVGRRSWGRAGRRHADGPGGRLGRSQPGARKGGGGAAPPVPSTGQGVLIRQNGYLPAKTGRIWFRGHSRVTLSEQIGRASCRG